MVLAEYINKRFDNQICDMFHRASVNVYCNFSAYISLGKTKTKSLKINHSCKVNNLLRVLK